MSQTPRNVPELADAITNLPGVQIEALVSTLVRQNMMLAGGLLQMLSHELQRKAQADAIASHRNASPPLSVVRGGLP